MSEKEYTKKKNYKATYRRNRRIRRMFEDSGGDMNSQLRHSTSYHDFFEDYSERYVTDKKTGKKKIERTYIGSYYCAEEKRSQWILRKSVYMLVFILSCVLFFLGVSRDVPGGYLWYALIPTIAGFFAMFYLFASLLIFMTRGRKMTIHEYKSGPKRLRLLTLISAAALFAAFLLNGLAALLNPGAGSRDVMISLFCLLGTALLMLLLYLAERFHKYVVEENENSDKAEEGMIIT